MTYYYEIEKNKQRMKERQDLEKNGLTHAEACIVQFDTDKRVREAINDVEARARKLGLR